MRNTPNIFQKMLWDIKHRPKSMIIIFLISVLLAILTMKFINLETQEEKAERIRNENNEIIYNRLNEIESSFSGAKNQAKLYWKDEMWLISKMAMYKCERDNLHKQVNSTGVLDKTEYCWSFNHYERETAEYVLNLIYSVENLKENYYNWPKSLFYTTLKADWCYVTQNEREHFKSNWRLATDIGCGNKPAPVYAPDYKNKEIKYFVELKEYPDTWNSVILHFQDWSWYKWLIWHVSNDKINRSWEYITTWELLWFMDKSWVTEWYHTHIELWDENDMQVSYKITNPLINYREWIMTDTRKWGDKFYFTTYDLWDVNQNDASPNIWASGKDLSILNKKWIKTIALTEDVRESLWIKFWDKVKLLWDDWCAWIFQVEDEMNYRFRYTDVLKNGYPIKWDIAIIDRDRNKFKWWICSVNTLNYKD